MYGSIYMKCPKLTNIERQRVEWFPGDKSWGGWGVTASLWCRNCFEMRSYWWLHNLVNIIKTTELYFTFKGWTLWYINCISTQNNNNQKKTQETRTMLLYMPAAMRWTEPDPTSMGAKNENIRERQGCWVLEWSPESICETELQDGLEMPRNLHKVTGNKKVLDNSKKKRGFWMT